MMTSFRFLISIEQLSDFKNHAVALSCELKSLDSNCRLTGWRRTDALAIACGYNNHGQMVSISKGFNHREELRLFTPENTAVIAERLCRFTKYNYSLVVAAIIRSASELYENDRWTVGDIKKYGSEVWNYVFPMSKQISEAVKPVVALSESSSSITNYFDSYIDVISQAFPKPLGIYSQLFPPSVDMLMRQTGCFHKLSAMPGGLQHLQMMVPQMEMWATLEKLSQSTAVDFSNFSGDAQKPTFLYKTNR